MGADAGCTPSIRHRRENKRSFVCFPMFCVLPVLGNQMQGAVIAQPYPAAGPLSWHVWPLVAHAIATQVAGTPPPPAKNRGEQIIIEASNNVACD